MHDLYRVSVSVIKRKDCTFRCFSGHLKTLSYIYSTVQRAGAFQKRAAERFSRIVLWDSVASEARF